MKRILILRLVIVFAGMVMLLPLANAEPSSAVAFDLPTVRMLNAADPVKGEALAKKHKCSKCHGDTGVSDDPDDINIAGMSTSYAYKQLKDFQDKKRDDRDMFKAVKKLEQTELADMAAWYAIQRPPEINSNRKQVSPEIKRLITHGDPKRLLKACEACHGTSGRGGQFDHPALAGQMRNYLVDSMLAFKEGDRTNDVYSRMRYVSDALTEEEIEALADYYAVYMPEEEDEDDDEDEEDTDE